MSSRGGPAGPRLSVVIPVLNEEAVIGGLLRHLCGLPGIHEVVVVDGGSTDGTAELVQRSPAARLVRSEPGRGLQLRAGASASEGDALLFLHADVVPPPDVAAQVAGAIERGFVGGNFRLRYPGGGVLGRWLEVLGVLYRRLGRYYGDSGIFAARAAYYRCGGFPAVPIMEDVIFVRRLERAGRTSYLLGPMTSSPRRWQAGPAGAIKTLALWAFMQAAHALGATPWQLARFYRPQREDPR